MSIKKSLRIFLILSSILPIILMSVILQGLINRKLIEVQTDHLKTMAEAHRSGLEELIGTRKTELSLLSLQNELQELALQSNRSEVPSSSEEINRILFTRKENYHFYEQITFYDTNRRVIASSDPELIGRSDHESLTLSYLSATRNYAVGVSGVKSSPIGNSVRHTIEIGCQVYENSLGPRDPIGYIVSTINLSYFQKFMDSITIGKTGGGILLDQDGTILYHHEKNLIGNPIQIERMAELVKSYNKGMIPVSGIIQLYDGDHELANGYCIIPEFDWVLVVKQNVSELLSVTSIILSLLIYLCAALLIIIILSAHFLTKTLTAPIIALRDAMRKASDGDLNVQSDIKSKNELGELSKNFNKMLHIIKTNYEDLSSMHEELLANEEQLRTNYDHIEYLAYHDTLTNLPNKLAFLDYVNAALVESPSTKKSHAVYFVDLDNFKTINDTLGHEYGDSLLVKTAQVLDSVIGENDMLARAGGDEFLIFKEGISAQEEATEFAAKIIECFRTPLELNGEIVYVSMSIGIAVFPQNGLSPNALIKNADIAMYKSKDTGKNKFTLFDAKMEDELNRNTLIIEVLRNAIDHRDIYIQYQPLFELSTDSVIGFEALMRIRNDRLGYLTPEEFIPIAEESGLIIELSSWLLREACLFNKEMIAMGIPPRPVSVNISSVQINRPGFTAMLSEILKETGLPPRYLELEITESTLVASIMDATTLLTSLQEIGVGISLDDFGTGYSSLNYLTKMPINTLKIDKSFIDNICTSEKDSSIAESIIQLAHSLEIKVVAEGVEHKEQLKLLESMHCDFIQGYIFSGPLHAPELVDLIRKV